MLTLVKSTTEFICFSSASGCLGSLGQVTYCAANVALDIMVDAERKYSGRRVVSIQWGGWSKVVAGSMSDKYNVEPAGPFETFYSATTGIEALSRIIQSVGPTAASGACMALDVSCWESYVSNTGVSKSLLSSLLMGRCSSLEQSLKHLKLPSAEQLLWLPQWHWLGDHRANDQIIFPATASLELLINRQMAGHTTLHNVNFQKTILAGDTLEVNDLAIKNQNGDACVSASSVSMENDPKRARISTRSALCVTLAALSLKRHSEKLSEGFSYISSRDVYSKMEDNGFTYGPEFALVNCICSDSDLNIAIGHVHGRPSTHVGEEEQSLFPLAPQLDACAHVCIALDEAVAASYPVTVEKFSIQLVDLNSLDDFANLDTFYKSNSVEDDDWVVICRRHSPKIELEFDIVCIRKRDSCVITFEQLCFKAIPRPLRRGDMLSCVVVSSINTSAPALEVVALNAVSEADAKLKDDDHFEVVVDADYKPTFLPLPSSQRIPHDHIVVRVTTYALNFLDILSSSGMMPKEYFGGECVGVIEAVGANVTRLQAGDRVALLLLGQGMKSELCVPVFLASPPLPQTITDEEAATIPVAYATAWLALEWMSKIKDGETALVHSAAGGVGLACVSILKSHRCRIFGTCSPGKETALEELGVQSHDIFHSRVPTSWLSGCMKSLNGKADVSLCLGAFVGDVLDLSLNLMAPLGRVIDFGKRDQFDQTKLNMAPFLKGLTYSAAHLDELMTSDEEGTERLLKEVWSSLNDKVRPLPFEKFSVRDIQAAMSRLASGNLIGKVVIHFPHKNEPSWEIIHSPQWMVAVHPGHFAFNDVNVLDLYLRRLGGAVLQDNAEESAHPTMCLKRCLNDIFPNAETCSEHKQSVIISNEMAENLSLFAESCAAVCYHALQHGDTPLFRCLEKKALLSAGCVPRCWRKVVKDIRAISSSDSDMGVLNWLLNEVRKSTGLVAEDLLLRTLDEVGFDSLSCLQLTHKLHQAFPEMSSFHISSHVIIGDLFTQNGTVPDRSPPKNSKTLVRAADTEPKKWLALHGFRMNNRIFRYQLENIIAEVDSMLDEEGTDHCFTVNNMDFPNAPLSALGPGEDGLEDLYVSIISPDGDNESEINMPLFEWWRSGDEDECYDTAWIGHDGLTQSFEWLRNHINNGGYAGVIGMSQGAGMAYLLMLTGIIPRGLLFSPVGPDNYRAFSQPLIDTAQHALAGALPLLVVWDPDDTPSEEFIRQVICQGPLSLQEVHHNGGHIVPQDVTRGKYAKKRHVADAIAKWLAA